MPEENFFSWLLYNTSCMDKTTIIAIESANKAGKLLERLVSEKQKERIKEVGVSADIVTQSDLLSEKLIIDLIHKNFPSHGILSEETSSDVDPKKHKHLWIVDPIDGTIAFAAGLPFWSVSISYFINQEPVSSALYLVSTKEVLWAETGKGAFVENRQLHVRDLPWEKSVIALDQGIRTRTINMTKLAPNLSGCRSLVMTPGEAGNLGLVARGNLQGLICSHPNIYDCAAGIHLVKEAGGIVTNYVGNPYPWFTRSGHVAAAPTAHHHIIEHARKVAKYFL